MIIITIDIIIICMDNFVAPEKSSISPFDVAKNPEQSRAIQIIEDCSDSYQLFNAHQR